MLIITGDKLMWWRLFHFAAGLMGAFHGYVVWVIASNSEDWAFYTIRSAVTGKKAMSEICDHPADVWVWYALFWLPVILGAVIGLLASGLIRRMRLRHVL